MFFYMKSLFIVSLLVLSSCQKGGEIKPIIEPQLASQEQGEPVIIGHSFMINSEVFATQRRLSVKLPARYESEPERRFPVMYIIDGGPEQDFPHLAGMQNSFDLNWSVEPMIVVGVETVNRRAEITPPASDPRYEDVFPERGGAKNFRNYIQDDVFTWVEKNYRVNQDRMVIGESLAGLFVVDTFLNEPELFTKYAAISPSLWWDNLSIVGAVPEALDDFTSEPREVYLTMANEGLQMQKGLDILIDGLESGAPENLTWHYVDRRNQEHHGSIYQPAALDAIRTFYPTAGWEGASPRDFYLFEDGVYPEISEAAKARIEAGCDNETAVRTSFEETNKDWEKWNAFCVIRKLGPPRTKGN